MEEEANLNNQGNQEEEEDVKVIEISSDEEEEVVEHDDPDGLKAESEDDATGNSAWIWKSASS